MLVGQGKIAKFKKKISFILYVIFLLRLFFLWKKLCI